MWRAFGKFALAAAISTLIASPVHAHPSERGNAALFEVAKAQDAISRSLENLRRMFESSSDYQQALSEVRTARNEYERAREDVLTTWQQTQQYKSVQLEIWKLQKQLDANRAEPEKIAELAEQLLQTRMALSKIESNLLGSDEKIKTARYAMLDAQAKAAALRENFVQSIRSDPQWQAARRQLDGAVRVASMTR
ncbi:MAG TPA: hypothetical protein VKK61_02545 [Tepidisphaeraceae bacterium]|nr:hypothetical protein [Tepidisphaeraceae bacterium]